MLNHESKKKILKRQLISLIYENILTKQKRNEKKNLNTTFALYCIIQKNHVYDRPLCTF